MHAAFAIWPAGLDKPCADVMMDESSQQKLSSLTVKESRSSLDSRHSESS